MNVKNFLKPIYTDTLLISQNSGIMLPYKKLYSKKLDVDRYGEVLIPRVRFKPGYQRI